MRQPGSVVVHWELKEEKEMGGGGGGSCIHCCI